LTAPYPLDPLLGPIQAIQRLIEYFDDQGVFIGGVAASLLGQPRLTADADAMFLLSINNISGLLNRALEEGLIPRLPDVEEFARRHRVVLLRHEESGIDVDISLGFLPFEVEAVERSQMHKVGLASIRLPTPEDLIILKTVAHRPKDMLDIQAIVANHSDLDRGRIRFWVRQFAELLEMPELWSDLEDILTGS
jgi:hypothetical protein